VEDQVEQRSSEPATVNTKQQVALANASRLRERQALELQRDRILDERTSSPIRRAALEAALKDIEAKLASL